MKDRPGMGSFVVVKTKTANSPDGLPKSFLNRFGEQVTGILSGLDRVRFRATLRPLFCPNGPELVYDGNRGAQLDVREDTVSHLAGQADTPVRRGVTGQITFMHANASRYAHKE